MGDACREHEEVPILPALDMRPALVVISSSRVSDVSAEWSESNGGQSFRDVIRGEPVRRLI